jgi:DNA-directed RNA polymerase subunit M/transcription elongation factor TFIIS
LVRLGRGDGTAGIAIIADHPALKRRQDQEDAQYRQNQLRAADEILKRFTDCYREAYS